MHKVWTRNVSSARYDRLEGELRIAEIEIEHYICAQDSGSACDLSCWRHAAMELLNEAKQALLHCQIDQG